MTGKNRGLALVLIAALLLVMVFSALFIAENAGHDCAQENCPICQQMEACENALNSIALAAAVAAIVLLLPLRGGEVLSVGPESRAAQTPVSLKVKLSN